MKFELKTITSFEKYFNPITEVLFEGILLF